MPSAEESLPQNIILPFGKDQYHENARIYSLSLLFVSVSLILFIAARPATETFYKINVRDFELVDNNWNQRASIKDESTAEVVLRLKDATGTIRVKVGTGEDGSGFVLLDDETNPSVHALAEKDGAKFTLTDKAGKKREY